MSHRWRLAPVLVPFALLTLAIFPGCSDEKLPSPGVIDPSASPVGLTADEVFAKVSDAISDPDQVFHTNLDVQFETPARLGGNRQNQEEYWLDPERNQARLASPAGPPRIIADDQIHNESGEPRAVTRCHGLNGALSASLGFTLCSSDYTATDTRVASGSFAAEKAVVIISEGTLRRDEIVSDVVLRCYFGNESFLPLGYTIDVERKTEDAQSTTTATFQNEFVPLSSLPDGFFDPTTIVTDQ